MSPWLDLMEVADRVAGAVVRAGCKDIRVIADGELAHNAYPASTADWVERAAASGLKRFPAVATLEVLAVRSAAPSADVRRIVTLSREVSS